MLSVPAESIGYASVLDIFKILVVVRISIQPLQLLCSSLVGQGLTGSLSSLTACSQYLTSV